MIRGDLPKIEDGIIVVPAIEQKLYDRLWVTEFKVFADDPNNVKLYAILRPSTESHDILMKEGTEKIVEISDLFGLFEGRYIDPQLKLETLMMGGQAMGMVLLFLKNYLIDKGMVVENTTTTTTTDTTTTITETDTTTTIG